MTDTANPGAGVESLSPAALESTLGAVFGDQPAAKPPKAPEVPIEASEETDPPQGEPTDDELPELLAEDDAPKEATSDEYELIHNGTPVKVNREELIGLGQKGYDYDRKMGALAESQKQVSQVLQGLAQVEQVQPMLAQELGQITALRQQLESEHYSDQAIYKLTIDDPFEAQKRSAERDMLRNAFQRAAGSYEQKAGAVKQYQAQLTAYQLQRENDRLPDLIPAWKSPEKRAADEAEMTKYIKDNGGDMSTVGRYLDTALAMKVLRQSMLYEKAQKAQKSKQIRTAPPVIRPGANVPSDKGRTDFTKVRAHIRKTGQQGNHRAQEEALLGLLNKTFKS